MTETLSPTTRLTAELFAPVTAEVAGGKATLRIFGRIDPDGAPWGVSSSDVQAALDSITDDVTDLEVQVQTRGGDAFEGVAIMNMIRTAKQNTEAVVVGLAASAGSYIVQGADKVTMLPHSQMMIHRGSILAIGQAPDMRMAADRLESIDKTMANIYTEKAGGTPDEWLAAMTPESWYTADEAVQAGLADSVRSTAKAPAGAKASLDLSVFAYAGREHAPDPYMPPAALATQTPAEPPETQDPHNKEAVTMTPDEIKALRERLGLAEDADAATINAKLDELEEQATKPPQDREITDEAIAKARNLKPEQVSAALDAAEKGKVAVSQAKLDEFEANAKLGAEARGKQLEQERDEAIAAAFGAGKISADRREAWVQAWDKDPEGTKKDLDDLPARFPVAALPGYAGGENTSADDELFGKFFPKIQEA